MKKNSKTNVYLFSLGLEVIISIEKIKYYYYVNQNIVFCCSKNGKPLHKRNVCVRLALIQQMVFGTTEKRNKWREIYAAAS